MQHIGSFNYVYGTFLVDFIILYLYASKCISYILFAQYFIHTETRNLNRLSSKADDVKQCRYIFRSILKNVTNKSTATALEKQYKVNELIGKLTI